MGNQKIFLGKTRYSEDIEIPIETLKRHVVALGASGSGKTVFGKCIIEEATIKGIPSILIDPQGDLASLILPNSIEEIEKHGIDENKLLEFKNIAEVRIFTPASSKGIPLSINPLKISLENISTEEIIRAIDLVSSSVIQLLGMSLEDDEGITAQTFLYHVLENSLKKKLSLKNFKELAKIIENPEKFSIHDAESIISKKERLKLAKRISYLSIGMDKLLFHFGTPLDMEIFLNPREEGKTPLNIIYLNTLSTDAHKQFFISHIAKEIYSYMLQNPSQKVQLIFYVDEISPFLPPHPYKPIAKDILKLLFKQGRKYGVACIMCTQNAADIDYKAMAQANTWALGRLMAHQDLQKVRHMLKSIDQEHLENILKRLPTLESGEFIFICPDVFNKAVQMKVRWLLTKHLTLYEDKLKDVIPNSLYQYFESKDFSTLPKISWKDGIKEVVSKRAREEKSAIQEKTQIMERKVECEIICKMNYLQNHAVKSARKYLEGGILKDEKIVDAEVRLLPLFRAKFEISKGSIPIIGKKVDTFGYLYFNGLNGKLLQVKDKIIFSDIVPKRAENVKSIKPKFEIRNKNDLPGVFVNPKVRKQNIKRKIETMFGIIPKEIDLIFLPIWEFKVKEKEGKDSRILYIDSVAGKAVEKPF